MQAKCPYCQTLFRLTESQLSQADGVVRCGVCHRTFNAAEQQRLDFGFGEDDLTLRDRQPPTLPDENREADLFDLFEETAPPAHSDDELVPQPLRQAIDDRPAPQATAIWVLAILFLAASLAGEYVWFNRHRLIQIEPTRPLVEHLCRFARCDLAALRAPAQIELLSRNIYSHPNEKNALMISVTLVNHANFAQPYPDMRIDFSDVRGKLVASRRFSAAEYLQVEKQQQRLLPPDLPSSFTLEIIDPGDQAMTYEFSFL